MNNFAINDEGDLKKLETLLKHEFAKKGDKHWRPFFFDAYLSLADRSDRGRLIASLIDLQLTQLFVSKNVGAIGGLWNQNLADDGRLNKQASILESPDLFSVRLEMLNHHNALALRARSFWDKYMGFVVMYFVPDEYENFSGARSRKKGFKKACEKILNLPKACNIQYCLQCKLAMRIL